MPAEAGGRRLSGKQEGSCPSASCRQRWDGDGRPSFFYAGREHAAIASMREKYTVMYPATATNGAVGIRCSSCQNRIGQLITPIGGSPFSVSRKLRFCPFCGVDLDAQIG